MKTFTYLALIVLMFASNIASAQMEVETVVSNTQQEDTHTYIDGIRYYYYPNLQAYFDTKSALYISNENGTWVKSETINQNSRGYSIKNGAYVMIKGYVGDEPYSQLSQHKVEYPADYSTKRMPPKNHPIASK